MGSSAPSRQTFGADTRANTTVLGVVILAITAMLGGLTIDTGTAWVYRKQLQAAADSAALAAVMALPDIDAARGMALDLVARNLPPDRFGQTIRPEDVRIGHVDSRTQAFIAAGPGLDPMADTVHVVTRRTDDVGGRVPTFLISLVGIDGWQIAQGAMARRAVPVGQDGTGGLLGELSEYLFVFAAGVSNASWSGRSERFAGDVAVNRGGAGWEREAAPGSGKTFENEVDWHDRLDVAFDDAVSAIQAMPATPGFEDVALSSLNGLDTRDGVSRTYVINVTSWDENRVIDIAGDPGDTFILRWDINPSTPQPEGVVRFRGGGGINPQGDLRPTNFVHLASEIDSAGGGSTPSGLARWVDDIPYYRSGGGYFTGYWLTTGNTDTGRNPSLANANIIGGWYTRARQFSLTGSSVGLHLPPPRQGMLAPGGDGADPDATRALLVR